MTGRRASDIDLNVRRLTREHVEAVCDEFGPDHAWMRLGISRSTLYKWRRDWRAADERKAAAEIQGDEDGYPGTSSIEDEDETETEETSDGKL